MHNIKNLTRLGVVLATLGIIALNFADRASAAVTMVPRPGGTAAMANGPSPSTRAVVRTVVVGGMPGWQIAAIAIAAAVAAATAAVLLERTRSVRRLPLSGGLTDSTRFRKEPACLVSWISTGPQAATRGHRADRRRHPPRAGGRVRRPAGRAVPQRGRPGVLPAGGTRRGGHPQAPRRPRRGLRGGPPGRRHHLRRGRQGLESSLRHPARGRIGSAMFHADLHIHSKFSRACSKDCDIEHLSWWALRKGLRVLGTGDFTHPAWSAELRETLVPAEPGLFRIRPDLEQKPPPRHPGQLRGHGQVHALGGDLDHLPPRRPHQEGAPPPVRARTSSPRAGSPRRWPRSATWPRTAGRSSGSTPGTCWTSRCPAARAAS